jgi:MFS family permease
LYLSYGIIVALGSAAFYVPLVSTISRWFPEKRGMMVGIGVSGIGFGIGIVPTIASQLMITFDWRTSLLIVGGTSIVLISILAQLLKSEPENLPAAKPLNSGASHKTHSLGLSFNQAMKTSQFWMIFAAWMLYGFFYQVGAVHTVPYATDLGMSTIAAATLLTIIGLIGIAGRSSIGYIGDKSSNKITLAVSFILIAAVFFTIAFSSSIPALYIYAVVYGIFSGSGVLLASINAEYFGTQALGAITGAVIFGNNFLGAFGPALAGRIYDANHSYKLAFILCGFAGVAAGVLLWLLKAPPKNDIKRSGL